jgi:hypothetical protein
MFNAFPLPIELVAKIMTKTKNMADLISYMAE